jgi:hypothetical protein
MQDFMSRRKAGKKNVGGLTRQAPNRCKPISYYRTFALLMQKPLPNSACTPISS